MMMLGNPLSVTTSAPEMLPGWSGQLGQFLPPGAAGHLLRSTAFFDGHDATQSVLVLVVWLVTGAALVTIAGLRSKRQRPESVTQGRSRARHRMSTIGVQLPRGRTTRGI